MINNISKNEVIRLLSAVQGYSNAKFFKEGLNRLLKNYLRLCKAKLPGPSYYQIPFHKEFTLMIFYLVTLNENLI